MLPAGVFGTKLHGPFQSALKPRILILNFFSKETETLMSDQRGTNPEPNRPVAYSRGTRTFDANAYLAEAAAAANAQPKLDKEQTERARTIVSETIAELRAFRLQAGMIEPDAVDRAANIAVGKLLGDDIVAGTPGSELSSDQLVRRQEIADFLDEDITHANELRRRLGQFELTQRDDVRESLGPIIKPLEVAFQRTNSPASPAQEHGL